MGVVDLQFGDLVQDAVDLAQDLAALVGEARHVLLEPLVLLAQPAQRLRGPAHRVLELSQSFDHPVTHSSLARLGRRVSWMARLGRGGPSPRTSCGSHRGPATSCGSQHYSPRHAMWNRALTSRATRSWMALTSSSVRV